MLIIPTIKTARLYLREWQPTHRLPFAELNADPRVMEFFPKCLTAEESDAFVNRIQAHFEKHGFGLWAVEVPGVSAFIGFVGLAIPTFHAHFMPCVEIGWRLAYPHWGKGYATEAARAVLDYGFQKLKLKEIVSFTALTNLRSQRVMQRIGMRHSPEENFDHPLLLNHPLTRHVLYRKKNPQIEY